MSHYMPRSMSRPIFWPLVLIAIGVVWLLSSFGVITELSPWVLLRFWPVALIALGLEIMIRPRWPFIANLVALATVTLAVLAVIFARQLGISSGGFWLSWIPFAGGNAAGSGHVITTTREVTDFDSITFSSFGDLTIRTGDHEGLTIEAEDNVVPEILTEMRGSTLVIRYAQQGGQMRVRPTQPVRLTLIVKQLQRVDLSGAGNVRVEGLQADHLQTTLSGAGNLEASGTVKQLDAVLSGAGSYQGGDLRAETATITLSGVGGATVWATQHLNVTVSGVGWVNYYGQPQLTRTVTGLGNVHSLGDK